MERQQNQADVEKMIVDAIQQERENVREEISSQINNLQHDDLPIWLALKYKFERLYVSDTSCRPFAVHPRDQDDPHDDAHPKGGIVQRGRRRNQEQLDDFDLWTDSYAIDDDELPSEKVSQELVEEMLQTIDEAKLHKVKGNSGHEKIVMSLHKFHAVTFPDNDIEERTFRWVDKCVKKFNPYARYSVEHWKNPHAKIFYIKKQKEPEKSKEVVYSNSKIVQIIKTYWELGYEHKFIIEIIARRANSSIVSITESDYKNLNKNDIKDLYLLIMNGKVDDYAETGLLWSLSVFIRSTVIWERVHDFQLGVESYQQKVNLTVPTITFSGIEKYKVFSIVSEPVYDIIYKNNKKEKRVMRHQEVHKFCDSRLKRVLEGLKSYNNNVKHGYVTPSKEDDEYLQLFKEVIEERLKHRDQMRR
ncbi:hypothetical protein Tco_0715163 [Tanacetum coccineum]